MIEVAIIIFVLVKVSELVMDIRRIKAKFKKEV